MAKAEISTNIEREQSKTKEIISKMKQRRLRVKRKYFNAILEKSTNRWQDNYFLFWGTPILFSPTVHIMIILLISIASDASPLLFSIQFKELINER